MKLISIKDTLPAHIVMLVGWLLLITPAMVRANDRDEGQKLYLQHCAACHGIKGDGHGALEHELTTQPTDLRLLSKRYGKPLPEAQIARFMDGRADVKAHGPRDMPVWGEEMWQYPEGTGNPNQVSDSVAKIIHYLNSIQIESAHASRQKAHPYVQLSADHK